MVEPGITGEMIEYRLTGGQATPGYLARPAAPGQYPGVMVIQEWWGVGEHIKDLARRVACPPVRRYSIISPVIPGSAM